MSLCPLCGSLEARVTDNLHVPASQAERLLLDLAAVVGVTVVVHPVRLTECPGCRPGYVTRHREAIVPLEAEYTKTYLAP